MKDLQRKLIRTIAIITLFSCLPGCANLMEGFIDGLTESKEDAKRKQQDPAEMIKEIEQKRWEETQRDIQRQYEKDQKEETTKKKQFDEMLQKQLQRQQEHVGG